MMEQTAGAAFNQKSMSCFIGYLERMFGRETAGVVDRVLRKLGLPVPEHYGEYLAATEGALLFLNDHGIVIRIENGIPDGAERINSNPRILQPLGSIKAGSAIIEICPGCHPCEIRQQAYDLQDHLMQDGVRFWDIKLINVGILPLKTPAFPEGVPVVIDRLAVDWLTESVAPVAEALERRVDHQKEIYGDLQTQFSAAWPDGNEDPDTEKMQAFWEACRAAHDRGLLVAGWNEGHAIPGKVMSVRNAARVYSEKCKRLMR